MEGLVLVIVSSGNSYSSLGQVMARKMTSQTDSQIEESPVHRLEVLQDDVLKRLDELNAQVEALINEMRTDVGTEESGGAAGTAELASEA